MPTPRRLVTLVSENLTLSPLNRSGPRVICVSYAWGPVLAGVTLQLEVVCGVWQKGFGGAQARLVGGRCCC